MLNRAACGSSFDRASFLRAVPSTASADITAFLGTNPTPVNRVTTGFGVGVGLVIVGFEFEYGHTRENLDELAPSLRTYMFNGLLQTPIPIAGMQFYGTAGAGVYHETLRTRSRKRTWESTSAAA